MQKNKGKLRTYTPGKMWEVDTLDARACVGRRDEGHEKLHKKQVTQCSTESKMGQGVVGVVMVVVVVQGSK
jgi:hypothetical protein